MSKGTSALRSVFMIMIFTLGSKVLGFIRDALIAAKFGLGIETDTFFLSLTAVTLFVTMLVRAINTTVVPILDEVEVEKGKNKKIVHTNNLLNVLLMVATLITFIAILIAPLIIKILALGFEGEQFNLAVLLMRIGLPVMLLATIVGVFRGYLQSELMFKETAMTQIPYNIVFILFLIFFSSKYGITGLMISSVLAVLSQMLIQIPGMLKTGYKYKPIINFHSHYIKKMFYLSGPVLISAVINDINKIVDKSLASTLVAGSISALDYADRIQQLVYGVFIMAITTVIYPLLSKEASIGSKKELINVMQKGFNVILIITIPATLGMIILAEPIVSLAFERGAFTVAATNMTSSALIFYTIGLVGISIRTLLYRVYYSLQDTKTPLVNSLIAIIINIILNLILIKYMGHNGLALATSIAAIITALLLLYNLRKKLGKLGVSLLITCGFKTLIASLFMAGIVLLLKSMLIGMIPNSFIIEFIMVICLIMSGVIAYTIAIYLLKVDEFKWMVNIIIKKFNKN